VLAAPLPEPVISVETRRYLPWLVAVALFMENLDATIVNTAVPTMAANLVVTPLSLKAVLTSYTISLAVFIPISGWMADRFGTRRVFGLAIVLFMLGSLFCGIAVNVPMLVASRVLQGMGGAMMTPVGRLALVRSFPRSEFLSVMNFVVVPALIGPLLGPFTGGLIVHWWHWRVIFFLNLPFGLLGLWLVRRHMPDYRDADTPPLDRMGFLLFGAGIALLSYVLEVFGEHTLPVSAIGFLLGCSAVLLGAYGWHTQRASAPVLALVLFRIRTFRLAVVGGFVTRLGIGGMPFLLPLLYQIGLGYKPWQAGLLTMPQALAAIGMKIFSNPLLARFGYRQILISNTVLLGCTIMVFTQIGPGAPIWGIVLLSLAQGFFASLQFTSMNSLIFADVADRDASKASSLASTGQQMSLSFGVAFASLLTAWFLGHVDQTDPAQTIPALHKAYFAMGVITVISSLTFWALHRDDGANVSNRPTRPDEAAIKPA
jgi:EmrB/QacA subfamily drug resistance transporter